MQPCRARDVRAFGESVVSVWRERWGEELTPLRCTYHIRFVNPISGGKEDAPQVSLHRTVLRQRALSSVVSTTYRKHDGKHYRTRDKTQGELSHNFVVDAQVRRHDRRGCNQDHLEADQQRDHRP
jgi:hypothetical protein